MTSREAPHDSGPDTPLGGRDGRFARRAAMVAVGLRMMVHDKSKFAGTVFGVVFAVVLSVQQLGILFGLLSKNTMFVENAGADIWIAPPDVELFQPGQPIPESALHDARTMPGVTAAAPLIVTGANVLKPEGGTEAVTLIGSETPYELGGPWNIVTGDQRALARPDTMFFEYSQRESLGGLTMASEPEVNGRRARVGGFTWGLQAFGPSYAFADYDFARELSGLPEDKIHFALARVSEDRNPEKVADKLAESISDAEVMTDDAFEWIIIRSLLGAQLGITFGTSTAFGLVVGLIIVALTMFSSVLDNLRQFGTLKALGCENRDLSRLVLVQATTYGLVGSFVGLGVVSWLAELIRAPQLGVVIPAWLVLSVPVVMMVLCIVASTLALGRVRKLEPGMVFR